MNDRDRHSNPESRGLSVGPGDIGSSSETSSEGGRTRSDEWETQRDGRV